jgi:hypothetical protein
MPSRSSRYPSPPPCCLPRPPLPCCRSLSCPRPRPLPLRPPHSLPPPSSRPLSLLPRYAPARLPLSSPSPSSPSPIHSLPPPPPCSLPPRIQLCLPHRCLPPPTRLEPLIISSTLGCDPTCIPARVYNGNCIHFGRPVLFSPLCSELPPLLLFLLLAEWSDATFTVVRCGQMHRMVMLWGATNGALDGL